MNQNSPGDLSDLSALSTTELQSVIEIVILNTKTSVTFVTDLCFDLFLRAFSYSVQPTEKCFGTFDSVALQSLARYVNRLSAQGRFSRDIFRNRLDDQTSEISLDILWWLDTCNIFYFEEYCASKEVETVVNQLINLFNIRIDPNKSPGLNPHQLACDLLLKAILAANQKQTSTKLLPSTIAWTNQCSSLLDQFLDRTLPHFFSNSLDSELTKLICLFGKRNSLNAVILKQFFITVLRKMLTFKENVDIYDAYLMQEYWTKTQLTDDKVVVYKELLQRLTLNELNQLFTNVQDSNKYLNWVVVLSLVSVYVKEKSGGCTELKELLHQFLKSALNEKQIDSIPQHLTTVLLFARQSCLALNQSYSDWYSETFGVNSTHIIGSERRHFLTFLFGVNKLIPFEPEHTLKVHIDRSLRVPPGCQTDMLQFKDDCRLQFGRLASSDHIVVNNIRLSVTNLIDHCLFANKITWALHQPEIRQLIWPFVKKEKKSSKILDLLLSCGYVPE